MGQSEMAGVGMGKETGGCLEMHGCSRALPTIPAPKSHSNADAVCGTCTALPQCHSCVRAPKLTPGLEVQPHQCRAQRDSPAPAGHTSADVWGVKGREGSVGPHITCVPLISKGPNCERIPD